MKFVSTFLALGALAYAEVHFEPNRGQSTSGLPYLARTANGPVALGSNGIQFAGESVQFEAAAARPGTGVTQAGVSHYAQGSDPARWLWNVPRFSRVRFPQIYPGIDAEYHPRGKEIEFDFLVAPGSDPDAIQLRFSRSPEILASGALRFGDVTLRAPEAWQTIAGQRRAVPVRFAQQDGQRAGFALGEYDRSQTLVIDPVVVFATYLGGSDNEGDTQVAAGADGSIFIAGTTMSADFPAEMPAESALNRPGLFLEPQAYVARMKGDGSALEWSLFLGGSGAEAVLGLQRDGHGNLILLGATTSLNFPISRDALRPEPPLGGDLFLVKLDEQTGQLRTSTYLGVPRSADQLNQGGFLGVDREGSVYVGGSVMRGSFLTTPGAFQPGPLVEPIHQFAMKLNPALSAVVYATLFDLGMITALSPTGDGSLVIGGNRSLYSFPIRNPISGIDQSGSGRDKAFLAKLNPSGTDLVFASRLHAGDSATVSDLQVDADGVIHVIGYLSGESFPLVKPLALSGQPLFGQSRLYWAKLPPNGGSFLQSTRLLQTRESNPLRPPRIFLQLNGAPCLANIGPVAATAGGNVTGPHDDAGTLACINKESTTLSLQSALPAGLFHSFVLAPDGSIFLSGTSDGFVFMLASTPGVLQPRFAGGVFRAQRFTYQPGFGDAVVVRLRLENATPQVTSIVPASFLLEPGLSGTRTFQLFGNGFAAEPGVTLNGEPVPCTTIDSHSIECRSVDTSALRAGANVFAVTTVGPGGGTSEATLHAIRATPSTVRITPSAVPAGSADTKVVVRGDHIAPDSVLLWNGTARTARFVPGGYGRNAIEVTLTAAELSTPATAEVSVWVAGPGGGRSNSGFFAVASAIAGDSAPSLDDPKITFMMETLRADPTLQFSGAGFTSAVRAYWDGLEVEAEYLSATAINLRPPPADLMRWGKHEVWVMVGPYRSNTIITLVARSEQVAFASSAPETNTLYVLTRTGYAEESPFDLLGLDMGSGAVVQRMPGMVRGARAMALSLDGRYVYVAAQDPTSKIVRVDTDRWAVDAAWELDPFPYRSGATLVVLSAIPGQPESVILWTGGGAQIYDRGQPRLVSTTGAGLPIQQDVPEFVTESRVFLRPPMNNCWRWMDFDSLGFIGTQTECSGTPPPEAVQDGPFSYLKAGNRAYVLASPDSAGPLASDRARLIDLKRRRLFERNAGPVVEYDLDSLEQRRLVLPWPLLDHNQLILTPEGRVLMINSNTISVAF